MSLQYSGLGHFKMTFEWAVTGSCSSSHCGHILSNYCMGGSTQSLCSSSTMYWPPVFVRLLCPILPCNLSHSCTKTYTLRHCSYFFRNAILLLYINLRFCSDFFQRWSVRKYLLGHVQSAWHSGTSGVHWPCDLSARSLAAVSRISYVLTMFEYTLQYSTYII